MVTTDRTGHSQPMVRRSIALALWAYFGWYLGVMVAHAAGLPSWVGPVAAVTMAAVALVDWRRLRAGQRGNRMEGLQPGS